jgi:hypothetical protein
MRAAEIVEENLQNIFGAVSVGKQYKRYAKYVAEKLLSISILCASLN